MKSSISKRLDYVDGLKVIMIFCVILCHMASPEYLGLEKPPKIWGELAGAGVSGFVILSSFTLTYGLVKKNVTDVLIIPFCLKRFLRIVPLYYTALFVYLLIVDLISKENLLAHLLFAHTFFREFAHHPGSLWFIGLITQCYLVFPLAYRIVARKHEQGLLILNITAVILYILGIVLQRRGLYVEDSFLRFSLEFALGINLAWKIKSKGIDQYVTSGVFIFSIIDLVIFSLMVETSGFYRLTYYLLDIFRTVSRICFFIFSLKILLFWENRWKHFPKIMPLLTAMSLASYPVYLFHRPIFATITNGPIWHWITHHISSIYLKYWLLGLISIPIIFIVSYGIQIAYDSIKPKVKKDGVLADS